jgi:hypothetical protein
LLVLAAYFVIFAVLLLKLKFVFGVSNSILAVIYGLELYQGLMDALFFTSFFPHITINLLELISVVSNILLLSQLVTFL